MAGHSDPLIADWVNLLEERKSLYKIESKAYLGRIEIGRVQNNLTAEERSFLESRPDYAALAEKAIHLRDQYAMLASKGKEANTLISSKYLALSDEAQTKVDKIVNHCA